MSYERRYGAPRTDVERAMNHYGISEEEYLADSSSYPLPERGTRLSQGISGGAVAIVLLLLAFLAVRKRGSLAR